MAENSLNIVDLVKGYLTGDTTNSISSLLGESKEKTQSGINAAVPGLLSSFGTVHPRRMALNAWRRPSIKETKVYCPI